MELLRFENFEDSIESDVLAQSDTYLADLPDSVSQRAFDNVTWKDFDVEVVEEEEFGEKLLQIRVTPAQSMSLKLEYSIPLNFEYFFKVYDPKIINEIHNDEEASSIFSGHLKGKGLGTKMYRAIIDKIGFITTSSESTWEARRVHRSLSKQKDLLFIHGGTTRRTQKSITFDPSQVPMEKISQVVFDVFPEIKKGKLSANWTLVASDPIMKIVNRYLKKESPTEAIHQLEQKGYRRLEGDEEVKIGDLYLKYDNGWKARPVTDLFEIGGVNVAVIKGQRLKETITLRNPQVISRFWRKK